MGDCTQGEQIVRSSSPPRDKAKEPAQDPAKDPAKVPQKEPEGYIYI